jgi:hypothetical protein
MKNDTRELLTTYIRSRILLFNPDLFQHASAMQHAVDEVTANIVNMVEQAINEAAVDIVQIYANTTMTGDN